MTPQARSSGDAGNGNPTLITYTTISQEYASLRYPGHCPLGMYLIPDRVSMFVWDGVFFVHQGSLPIHRSNLSLCTLRQIKADVAPQSSLRSLWAFFVVYDDVNWAFIKAITRIAS